MDASSAIAMNKPTIIIRPESLIHPLKELSNKANVAVETVDQAIDVISYILNSLMNKTVNSISLFCF